MPFNIFSEPMSVEEFADNMRKEAARKLFFDKLYIEGKPFNKVLVEMFENGYNQEDIENCTYGVFGLRDGEVSGILYGETYKEYALREAGLIKTDDLLGLQ